MSLATKSRSTSRTKKRQAQHHRRSKRYLKAYWPYIPMLVIVGLGLFINSLWMTNSNNILGTQTNLSRASLLAITNQDRATNSEPALRFNTNLNTAAQNKANDMVSNNYWAHISPSGKTPWSFIISSGYQYQLAGENLAYGFLNSSDVLTAWMNSQEHRANILNANYEDVGFGIAESANYINQGPRVIVVAEYGEPLIGVPTPVSAPIVSTPAIHNVSRFQILSGSSATWSELVLTTLTGALLTIVIIRHGFYLRKIVSRSELFVMHHPFLDILFVLLCVIGLLLSRSVGLIG